MRRPLQTPRSAFLLPETIIAMSIFSAISLALMMGFISLERSLAATTSFATSHTDAMRISDYLALDLRRALSIQTTQNDTTLIVPAYYDVNGNPQTPSLDGSGGIAYGTSGSVVHIRYYLLQGKIYRQQDASTAVAIADNVSDFLFTVTDLGKVATTRITFKPNFVSSGATQAVINGSAFYNTTLLRNSRTDIVSTVY